MTERVWCSRACFRTNALDSLGFRSDGRGPADARSVFILFGGKWGSCADVEWNDDPEGKWQPNPGRGRCLTKPGLRFDSVLRADRYEAYFRRRHPRGAATINSFPFFDSCSFADDLVERFIEHLREETDHPAEDIVFFGNTILMTAAEKEVNLLATWQMLCGVCNRLDLIDRASYY